MIYHYEQAVLNYFNEAIKDIKVMTYATSEQLLEAMANVKKYPAMYFTRSDTEIKPGKLMRVKCGGGRYMNVSPYPQTYKAYILVESQEIAFRYLSQIRAQWNKCAKVWFEYEPLGMIPVQLRLLGLKTSEQRAPNDTKGACRSVEVEWSSILFLDDSSEKLSFPIVESYQLAVGWGLNFKVIAKGKLIDEELEVKTSTTPTQDD